MLPTADHGDHGGEGKLSQREDLPVEVDLPAVFFWFPEISQVHGPTGLPIPQPLFRIIIDSPVAHDRNLG